MLLVLCFVYIGFILLCFCSSLFVLSGWRCCGCCVGCGVVAWLLSVCSGLCFVVKCLGTTLPARCFGCGLCIQDFLLVGCYVSGRMSA